MSNQIALVLDGKVTETIKSVAKKMPVWILQTHENAAFIVRLRQEPASGYSITTFPSRQGESKADLAERIIYTLDVHHDEHSQEPPYDTLLVYGLTLEESKKEAFRDLEFLKFEETDFGFIARKLK